MIIDIKILNKTSTYQIKNIYKEMHIKKQDKNFNDKLENVFNKYDNHEIIILNM